MDKRQNQQANGKSRMTYQQDIPQNAKISNKNTGHMMNSEKLKLDFEDEDIYYMDARPSALDKQKNKNLQSQYGRQTYEDKQNHNSNSKHSSRNVQQQNMGSTSNKSLAQSSYKNGTVQQNMRSHIGRDQEDIHVMEQSLQQQQLKSSPSKYDDSSEDDYSGNHLSNNKNINIYQGNNGQEMTGEPLQLVKISADLKNFEINQEALEVIRDIDTDIGIVAVSGAQRTGKSFILNLLLDKNGPKGFKISPSTKSCTQGIWIWGKPIFVKNRNMHVILLDTEGSGSLQKNQTHDL